MAELPDDSVVPQYRDPAEWPALSPDELVAAVNLAAADFNGPVHHNSARLIPALPNIIPVLPKVSNTTLNTVLPIIIELDKTLIPAILRAFKVSGRSNGNNGIIWQMAELADKVLPAVIEALIDEDDDVRNLAGFILRRQGSWRDIPLAQLFQPLAQIAPQPWPGRKLPVDPGDLSLFMINGDAKKSFHPFTSAPYVWPNGGVIYFTGSISHQDFQVIVKLLGLRQGQWRSFACFVGQAVDTEAEMYLFQLRLIDSNVLSNYFRIIATGAEQALINQPRSIEEVCWAFIQHQQAYWSTYFSDLRAPAGAIGGDGDYAREELAFGMMMESYGVYRIWSRAWLVEK